MRRLVRAEAEQGDERSTTRDDRELPSAARAPLALATIPARLHDGIVRSSASAAVRRR